jgi:hypothetical protein
MKSTSGWLAALWRRVVDWRHERRIHRMSSEVIRLILAGEKTSARVADVERMQLIRSRSPAQVKRMERLAYRRMDLASRRIFDQHRDGGPHA